MANIAIGEAFVETISTMSEYVDTVQNQIEKVFNDFDFLIKNHPWEVTNKTAFKLQEKYNSEVLDEIQRKMGEWGGGEASYLALVRSFKMGEGAVNNAERQQNDIIDKIVSISHIEIIPEQRNFIDSHFDLEIVRESLQSIADNVKSSLPATVNDYQSKLEKLSEENEIVKSIVNIGKLYGESIENFVTDAVDQIHKLLDQYTTHMETNMERALEDEEKKVNSFVQNVEQSVESMTNFIERLFEDDSY